MYLNPAGPISQAIWDNIVHRAIADAALIRAGALCDWLSIRTGKGAQNLSLHGPWDGLRDGDEHAL
jgi:hypothetical protein